MTSFKKIFAAPFFDDEVKTQQAYLLHIILWVLVCVPIPFVIYTLILTPDNFSRALLQATFGEVVNVTLLFILRHGYVRAASIIQVSAFWLFFTATAFTENGVQSEAYLLGYGLVIVIAGILLGGTGASVFTFLSLAAGGWLVYGQMRGTVNLSFENTPLTTWVVSFVLFPVGAVLQNLASRTLRIALTRARASEEKYRLISQVSSDYTFATEVHQGGNANLCWVAGAFEKMTGYTFEEYVDSGSWLAHVHPDDLEKDAQDMEKLHKNQDIKSEIRTFTKNGEIRWEHIFAHPVWDEKENRLIGIFGAVQDITEQKQTEEALTHERDLLQIFLDNIPDTVYFKDAESRFVRINKAQARFLGVDNPRDAIGKTDLDFQNSELAREFMAEEKQIIETGQSVLNRIEFNPTNDGSPRWLSATKVPVKDSSGRVIGTIGLSRDVTERKRAELEREKLITELETKNAELERFTYTVSHDLKSPLVTIRGFLGYLEQDAQAGNFENFHQDVHRIETAAKKMQDLLRDLLELSRIGRLMNAPVETSFNELVKDALELLDGQIKEKKVLIEYKNNNVIITCDQVRMLEVLQNLIDNAIKFMGAQPNPRIEIGISINDRNETIFYIKDNGIGIAPEFHEKIFGLFNKLTSDGEGTGVGLALVKRIIEVHGGRIWVESQVGKGATFYFTLP